jgi:enamine deaminase RidA (YjgF/YER057c/UK114 family)
MEIINPPALARPKGYSHGVRTAGTVLAVAGQVGWDREGRLVAGDLVGQFAVALQNVVEVVRAAGGEPESLVRLTLYLTDKEEYLRSQKALGVEYRRIMGRHYPAMTAVEVKGLVEPGAKVEIEGLAVL